MRHLRIHSTFLIVLLVFTVAVAHSASAQQKLPDSTLYTVYSVNQPLTQVQFSVCGSLPQSEGCYGGGTLGPFTNACAIVQSVPALLNFTTVLRYIYVLDTGSSTSGATLTAYKRTDTISATFDTIRLTTLAVVPVPDLVAGANATCLMVQNPTNVYVATKQGTEVLAVNKTNFSATVVGSGGGVNVSALTADSYGYVTADWGTNFPAFFQVFGPDGSGWGSGGGSYFMTNPNDAIYLADVPPMDHPSSPKFGYTLKVR